MTQDARAKAEEALKLAQTKAALLQANSAPKRPGTRSAAALYAACASPR
jgi:hypothetical protein